MRHAPPLPAPDPQPSGRIPLQDPVEQPQVPLLHQNYRVPPAGAHHQPHGGHRARLRHAALDAAHRQPAPEIQSRTPHQRAGNPTDTTTGTAASTTTAASSTGTASQHRYTVHALDGSGNEFGEISTPNLTYGPQRAPDAPRNVRLTSDGQQLRILRWNDVNDAWLTGYVVQKAPLRFPSNHGPRPRDTRIPPPGQQLDHPAERHPRQHRRDPHGPGRRRQRPVRLPGTGLQSGWLQQHRRIQQLRLGLHGTVARETMNRMGHSK